jgi:hypothetical protein
MSSWEGTFSPLSASVPQFGNILLSSSLLGGRDCYCPFNTCRWEGLLSSVQHFLLLINQHFKLCMSGSLPHAEAEVNGISSATDNNSQSSLPRRHNLREPSPCWGRGEWHFKRGCGRKEYCGAGTRSPDLLVNLNQSKTQVCRVEAQTSFYVDPGHLGQTFNYCSL